MLRIAALIAAATALGGTAAQAGWYAKHHRHRHYYGPPAAYVPTQPSQQLYPSRPSWAPEGACFTDEGYGRFLPCGAGGRGA